MNLKKTSICLNCHANIGDANYCPHCGQLNTDKRISLRQVLEDFFGDYFTFDSKFFRSLIPLIIKPGYLTKEYLAGRRVNYIFPLRLYIFTTFIFFFVVAVNTKIEQNATQNIVTTTSNEAARDTLASVLNKHATMIPSDIRTEIISKIDSAQATSPKKDGIKFVFFGDKDPGDSKIKAYFNKKAKYLSDKGHEGATLFWKEMINQFPKELFVLLPIFALILKLMYLRHKIFYVEHLIFSLHVHTFIFLYLLISVFFSYWYIILLTIIGIFAHLYFSLRNVYQQSYVKTFIKMNLMLFMYTIVLVPAFVLLVLLAVISV